MSHILTRVSAVGAVLVAVLGAAACAVEDEGAQVVPTGTDPCAKQSLVTHTAGTLTIATSNPAYPPWVDGEPREKKGFESAVAYAVAGQLGFGDGEVTWVGVEFEQAIAPGPKDFDFDINQFSITDERKQAVDFSSPYYDVQQVVVTYAGSPIDGATSLAALKTATLAAPIGTTSLDAIEDVIKTDAAPVVLNTVADVVLQLNNHQIDGAVFDLPTAFYLVAAELDDGVLVGQVPPVPGAAPEQFGLLLDKGSPLTTCVSAAVDALRADGTLASLEAQWLTAAGLAPVLS